MMNTTSSSTSSAFQNPQIIRISYPRTAGEHRNHRKPDEQSIEQRLSSFLVCPPQSSSATVPQIVSILNPVVSTVTASNAINNNNVNGMLPNAKKCTFHRQCLHMHHQQQQQQQPAQQQIQQHLQNAASQIQQQQQTQQNFSPLQTPSSQQQQQVHPQLIQQQQQQQQSNRISPNNNNSSSSSAINRNNSTQANRDAISTNIQPQLNAALLQDRYLLLDMVDGSSFYKCIDIQTQKLFVCKVFIYLLALSTVKNRLMPK